MGGAQRRRAVALTAFGRRPENLNEGTMTKLDDPGVMEQVRYLRLQRGFSVTGIVKMTGLSHDDATRAVANVDRGQSGKPGRKRADDDAKLAKLIGQDLSNDVIAQRLGDALATVKQARKRFTEAAE